MKAVHIINELSEKNFSINLLTKNIIDYTLKNFKVSSNIICNKSNKNFFFRKKRLYTLEKKNFFKKMICMYRVIKHNEIIHIHGLWNVSYILSIFLSVYLKKKVLIHLHGILLDHALNNNSVFFKKKIKFLIIFLLNFILNKKCYLIAITNQEKKSIRFFFKKKNIIEIPNSIEKNITIKNINYIKRFVFFGRVNKIKNLNILIDSFLKANINKKFCLCLYLINDDYNLKKKLKRQINLSNRIFIKKPTYGLKKDRILQKSWANVLLSKSEVISYSVLEASINELPSIVTKEISIKNFDKNGGEVVNSKLSEIIKKIESVSRWSLSARKKKGKNIRKFISNKFSSKKSFKKLDKIYA